MPDGSPRFSLVIPARNEEAYLPRLLDSVDVARARYAGGADAVEVIVADNVSTDATAEIARRRGCRVVSVEKRIIGAVRNGGARAARGEILCFVDADARIHPDTFGAIERRLDTGKIVGGATGIHLERMSLGLIVTWAVLLPLVWLTRMDTGVTFCKREDFATIGGYDEEMPAAEDVRLLFDLWRLGRRRGQRLGRARSAKAIYSTRKFDRFGDWHYVTHMPRAVFWLIFRKGPFEGFINRYWYGDQR